MSRLELSRRHWKQAIAYGENAAALALDPGTLGVLSDAYAGAGDLAPLRTVTGLQGTVGGADNGHGVRYWVLGIGYVTAEGRRGGSPAG